MKCKICNGSGTLEIANNSEYDESFCDCGNCGGTGVVKKKSPQNLPKANAYSLLADVAKNDKKCIHCEFLYNLFNPILKSEDSSNREYFIFTELFVYLHQGKDFCDFS